MDKPKELTQKELCYKMLRKGRSTKDFLNSRLCAEYRKWISIIRSELKGTGEYIEPVLVDTQPRNFYYKIEKLHSAESVEPGEGDSSLTLSPNNSGGDRVTRSRERPKGIALTSGDDSGGCSDNSPTKLEGGERSEVASCREQSATTRPPTQTTLC